MTAIETLAKAWNKKYSTQPYENHHLHFNYEDLVLEAMEKYADEKIREHTEKIFTERDMKMAIISAWNDKKEIALSAYIKEYIQSHK